MHSDPDRTPEQHSAFNVFWLGQALSHVGSQITLLAIPLIASAMLAATPSQMGYLLAAESLPYLLFSLPAGAWVDRLSRRRVLVTADLARAALLVSIPVVAVMGGLSLPYLLAIGFGATTAAVFHDIAGQASLPGLVAASHTMNANARLEFTRASAAAVGPGLAGFVAQLLSPALCLLPTAASHVVGALTNSRLPRDLPAPRMHGKSMLAEIGEGLRFVAAHPVIRALTACALVWNCAWYAMNAVFVLFATRELGFSPGALGTVLAAQGGGMLLGALMARRLKARLQLGRAILVGPILSVLACVLVSAIVPGPSVFFTVLVGEFLFGFGPMVWTVTQLSTRQNLTPAALQGRVGASIRFASYGMRPVGALLGGWAASAAGLQPTILMCAAMFLAAMLPLWFSPIPRLTDDGLAQFAA